MPGIMPQTTSKKRKRAPATSASPEAEDDSRAKGRPRVDKQDGSAADRRRAQIRMAQRAYRQRKESTLDELRKRVSELTTTAELMNKTFLELKDLLSINNSAGQKSLWDTSLRFEQLMQAVRNPNEQPPDLLAREAEDREEVTGASRIDMMSTNVPAWMDHSIVRRTQHTSALTGAALLYGLIPEEKSTPASAPPAWMDGSPMAQASRASMLHPAMGYDLVAGGKELATQNEPNTYDIYMEPPSPLELQLPGELASVKTYSFQETSFGRRLHRASMEAGYYASLDPSRSDRDVEKMFRLSCVGRDRAKLMLAMKDILARGANQSLDFTEAPLIHVGGAGTHYPRRDQDGVLQTRKTSYDLGPIGPQTLALLETAARNNLSTDMTVQVAGYEGEWFDPYDVEGYLEEKGIHIDSTSSFVEVRIDVHASELSTSSGSGPSTPPFDSAATALGLEKGEMMKPSALEPRLETDGHKFSTTEFPDVGYSDAITGDWMTFLEPSQQDMNWLDFEGSSTQTPIELLQSHNMATTTNQSLHTANDLSALDFDAPPHIPPPTPPRSNTSAKEKSVMIDVAKLLKSLIKSGACLGRTPGYRRDDVDRALAWASFEL
ncbi:hypothetical protein LTR62_003131 [Meristemomyces frigidus]|uniref:BZIP domain-containing protein n=1 Tax=Meristemomyces frigidus TaxID=1508187 RepID=A0AAN7TFE4_9PEZI|nr:hypothetical protein LTR62_003131 [Meristemomyces frigidus]